MDDSPGDDLNPSAGLLRQRRNLIVSSMVFLLVCLGGAHIDSLSFGGGTITFERPGVIYIGLWLVQIYFFVRYLQYIGADEKLLPEVANSYRSRTAYYLNRRFHEAIDIGSSDRWSYEAMNWLWFRTPKSATKGRLVAHLRISHKGDANNAEVVPFYSAELPFTSALYDHIRGFLFTLLWRPFGTDFVLPLILAVAVLIFGAFANWQGAPSQLLNIPDEPELLNRWGQ